MAQIGGHSINSFKDIHFLITEEEFRKPPGLKRVEIDSMFSHSLVGEHYSVESRMNPKPSL